MSFLRHKQHAEIEDDISRHPGQDKWPQSKHRARKNGHSGRSVIGESRDRHFHCPPQRQLGAKPDLRPPH